MRSAHKQYYQWPLQYLNFSPFFFLPRGSSFRGSLLDSGWEGVTSMMSPAPELVGRRPLPLHGQQKMASAYLASVHL